MINGFVRGQQLTVRHPVIAADTINYLTALFTFHTRDWAGLEKWTHWQRGDVVYDIPLVNDQITENAHLNLGAGEWTVWIHGGRYADGIVVQRITTDKAKITVVPTGILDGEPFPTVPPSAGEQIIASAQAAEAAAKDAAESARTAESAADRYANNADLSANAAAASAKNAVLSETNAKTSETNAASSASSAAASAKTAEDAADRSVNGGAFISMEIGGDGCLYMDKTENADELDFYLDDTGNLIMEVNANG